MIRTVLFDLDGTIVDTEPAAARVVAEALRDWGVAVTPEDSRFVTGRTWATAFEFLFKKYRLPVSREEAAKEILDRYRARIAEELPVVPGSVEAVKSLAEAYPLALVSGSHRSEILWALGKLGIRERFQVILGAEDYPKSKPAPDGYQKALGMLGHEPQHGLVFEDSHAGVTSALAAGLWVVAITGTNHFDQDTSGAHHRIADLRSVNSFWITQLKLK